MKLQMCKCETHGGLVTDDGRIALVASKAEARATLEIALRNGMIDEAKKVGLLAEVEASGLPEEGKSPNNPLEELLGLAGRVLIIEVRVGPRRRGLADFLNF